MSSPIAHSLAGLSIGYLSWRRVFKSGFTLKAGFFCVVMANLPDFDVIPGIFAGDINRFHHAHTHTLLFAFLAWLVVYALARENRGRWAFMALVLVLSHFLIDYATIDTSPPIGLRLLWPLQDMAGDGFKWSRAFLPVVARGDSLITILNFHNIRTAAIETAIFLPVTLVSFYLYKKRIV